MKNEDKKSKKVKDKNAGFDIKINEFGEVTSGTSVEQLNEFLNENTDDKKLREKKEKEKNIED